MLLRRDAGVLSRGFVGDIEKKRVQRSEPKLAAGVGTPQLLHGNFAAGSCQRLVGPCVLSLTFDMCHVYPQWLGPLMALRGL